ncbi:MAG: dihydroorotase [Bacteriovorax sp. MedPE-SWde]|nr:MAG: dihydroorotase [Bacteriovorax sp. MedPE-SWde]
MSSFDLLVKNGTLTTSKSRNLFDIGIKDGKIVEIGTITGDAKRVIDASGLNILPGLIDTQVHFREPGPTHKEDLESGSRAAALGGICTFFEMPNTSPTTTTVEKINDKVELAKSKSHTNFGFYIGGSENNLEELLKAEDLEGCCGVKIFLGSSTGDLLLYKREVLIEIFKKIKMPIAVHSESEPRLLDRISIRDNAKSVHAHYEWRDAQTALESTKMIIEVAKEAGRKVHILHVSTKDEMDYLAKNKEHCTVEATPQHLTLIAPDAYDQLGAFAQMNPPIRTAEHKEGIWEGLMNGTVDVLGSDHAPHTIEEKERAYPRSPSGMPGVQTIFPIMLKHMNEGRITLEKIIELLSETPAKLYSLNKGRLEVGADADLTIVDLDKVWTIENEDQASKCGWTPFAGTEVKGKPTATIVMGQVAMLNDEVFEIKPSPIKRG